MIVLLGSRVTRYGRKQQHGIRTGPPSPWAIHWFCPFVQPLVWEKSTWPDVSPPAWSAAWHGAAFVGGGGVVVIRSGMGEEHLAGCVTACVVCSVAGAVFIVL